MCEPASTLQASFAYAEVGGVSWILRLFPSSSPPFTTDSGRSPRRWSIGGHAGATARQAHGRPRDGPRRVRVADETLRQQHQALAEAHYTIATERQRYHDSTTRIEALLVRYHLLSEHARDIVLFIRLDGQIVEGESGGRRRLWL